MQEPQVLERFLNIDNFAWAWDCLRNLIEEEAEIELGCSFILEEMFDWFRIDFEVDLGSEIDPKWSRKSSWKGDRKKKGERWAYRGQLGSKMGSCWAENRRRLESKKNMEKRSEKKRGVPVGPRKFGGSGARRKPLAKGLKDGGLMDVACYLTRHWPKAWRITSHQRGASACWR